MIQRDGWKKPTKTGFRLNGDLQKRNEFDPATPERQQKPWMRTPPPAHPVQPKSPGMLASYLIASSNVLQPNLVGFRATRNDGLKTNTWERMKFPFFGGETAFQGCVSFGNAVRYSIQSMLYKHQHESKLVGGSNSIVSKRIKFAVSYVGLLWIMNINGFFLHTNNQILYTYFT